MFKKKICFRNLPAESEVNGGEKIIELEMNPKEPNLMDKLNKVFVY